MNTIRAQIIKQFCKSIAWIDDEIVGTSACEDQLPPPEIISKHFNYFSSEAELLYKSGMLCSLIPFEPSNSLIEIDQQVNRCVDLTASADAIILDWQLGAHQDYSNCQKIIQKIFDLQGIRFIVVLSNFPNQIAEALRSEISTLDYCYSTEWLSDNNGKFITIAEKTSGHVADILLERLLNFSNSLLTWVAIEISNIIRKTIPTLIKSIPDDADGGFLLDYYFSGKKSFTADTIICNMLEDINYTVKHSTISSLSDAELDDNNSSASKMVVAASQEFISILQAADLQESFAMSLAQKIISNSERIDFNQYENVLKDDLIKAYKFYKDNPQTIDKLSHLINSVISFTSYCEALSIKPNSSSMMKVCRGNIYSSSEHPSSLYLCVSQACDAEHKKQIFFLEAKRSEPELLEKRNRIFITINGFLYSILLSPVSLVIHKKSDLTSHHSSFSLVGNLRSDTIENISNRFWAHITRVGVNLPCVDRALRK